MPSESSRLGYALWPELRSRACRVGQESSRLGYALWPELHRMDRILRAQSSRLGYALWPEHGRGASTDLALRVAPRPRPSNLRISSTTFSKPKVFGHPARARAARAGSRAKRPRSLPAAGGCPQEPHRNPQEHQTRMRPTRTASLVNMHPAAPAARRVPSASTRRTRRPPLLRPD